MPASISARILSGTLLPLRPDITGESMYPYVYGASNSVKGVVPTAIPFGARI